MIRVMVFARDGAVECGGEELLERALDPSVAGWIDLQGDREMAERVLHEMKFHPLAIEDTFMLHHQPRVEEYDDDLFVIVRGIDFNEEDPSVHLETLKLAAFLRSNLLITIHRAPLRSVETVRRRVEENRKALPGGVAQLLWSICDEMMDQYFPILDGIGTEIEKLEVSVLDETGREQLETILELRRRLGMLRRIMLPHRAVFNHLANSRHDLFDATASLNFRDTLDNVLRLTDAIDQQRDQLANVKDTYLSVVSQKTNEIMKVLTLFSAIMLPLTFIAGVYGMNFEHMPELGSRFGYPGALALMALVAAGLFLYFRRKRWI
jgi:magnesium transporter